MAYLENHKGFSQKCSVKLKGKVVVLNELQDVVDHGGDAVVDLVNGRLAHVRRRRDDLVLGVGMRLVDVGLDVGAAELLDAGGSFAVWPLAVL